MARAHNHYRDLSPRDRREIALGMPVLGLPSEYRPDKPGAREPDTKIRGMQGPEPLRIKEVDEILFSEGASVQDLQTLEERYGEKVRLIEPGTIIRQALGSGAVSRSVEAQASEAA